MNVYFPDSRFLNAVSISTAMLLASALTDIVFWGIPGVPLVARMMVAALGCSGLIFGLSVALGKWEQEARNRRWFINFVGAAHLLAGLVAVVVVAINAPESGADAKDCRKPSPSKSK